MDSEVVVPARVVFGRRPGATAPCTSGPFPEVVQRAWAEAGPVVLRLICAPCGAGKRAQLGEVRMTGLGPLLTIEIVARPPADRSFERLAAEGGLRALGWRRRGEPDAPCRGYLMAEWWQDPEAAPEVYCASHKERHVTFARIATAIESGTNRLAI